MALSQKGSYKDSTKQRIYTKAFGGFLEAASKFPRRSPEIH
jgi:hypothetical protein